MRFRLAVRYLPLLLPVPLLLALAGPAQALTVRCAGTVAQLSAALVEANASVDTAFIIRLRTGTYDVAQAPERFQFFASIPDQVIELSGGWTGSGGTCQTKSFDPSLTVLQGSPSRAALTLGLSAGTNSASTAYVNDVTLRNLNYTSNENACLSGFALSAGELRIERVHMDACMASPSTLAYGAGSVLNSGALLTMRNVSVRNSGARSSPGLVVSTEGNGVSNLAQISITTAEANHSAAPGSGLYLLNYDNAIVRLSNSVVWGNDPTPETADIRLQGTGIHLSRVHYGSLSGTPASNNTPTTGDPGFLAVGNARLRSDSILIDSGMSSPTGGTGTYDADGNARVQGPGVDVGAFEATPDTDTIFRNGFDL